MFLNLEVVFDNEKYDKETNIGQKFKLKGVPDSLDLPIKFINL